MRLYDPDEAVNARRPLKDNELGAWEYGSLWKFEDGTFELKFLNHSEKCPDGSRLTTTHRFDGKKPNESWKEQPAFFCTEVTHGLRQTGFENEEGDTVIALVPVKPCPACDLIETARQKKTEDGDSWFDDLDEDYQKILVNLDASRCRTYLFPVIVYAKAEVDDSGKTKKTAFVESDKPIGMVLELKPGRDKADAKILKQIIKAQAREGDELFHPDGVWVTLTKDRGCSLELGRSRKLNDEERKIYNRMKDISKIGAGVDSGSFKRESLKVGWDRGLAMMAGSYWGKKLAKRYNLDWDDIEEGIACQLDNEVEIEEEEDDGRSRKSKRTNDKASSTRSKRSSREDDDEDDLDDDEPKRPVRRSRSRDEDDDDDEDEPRPRRKAATQERSGKAKPRSRDREDDWVDSEEDEEEEDERPVVKKRKPLFKVRRR